MRARREGYHTAFVFNESAPDAEPVRLDVLPSDRLLENGVEAAQREVGGHPEPPPDGRNDLDQGDLDANSVRDRRFPERTGVRPGSVADLFG